MNRLPLIVCLGLAFVLVGCKKQAPAPAPTPGGGGATPSDTAPMPDTPNKETVENGENKAAEADADGWHSLFDGKTLGNWGITKFGGEGEVRVEEGAIVLPQGSNMTGVTWQGESPVKINYEIEYKAKRTAGTDFFGTLTFPVGENPLSFVLGGWGGSILGLSNLSFYDASDNESTKILGLESNRWYTVRIRVEAKRITTWLDGDQLFSIDISNHDIGIRTEVELSKPLGFSTFATEGHIKDIRWRAIEPGEFDVEEDF